jgi:hypothetical protein
MNTTTSDPCKIVIRGDSKERQAISGIAAVHKTGKCNQSTLRSGAIMNHGIHGPYGETNKE